MWNEEQWKRWAAWHNDWKQRRDETYKNIKRYYRGSERQELLKRSQKGFMNELWIKRKEILGW